MADGIQEQISNIVARFPRLYHFGPVVNRGQIERFKTIFSAELIRTFAFHPAGLSAKRQTRKLVETPFGSFTLNDQQALKYAHVKHPDSLIESDFIALLDQFAFFWPGDERGPGVMGRNFVNRYTQQGDSLLQILVSTESFLTINNSARLFISTCNSGAPRSNPHKTIYRGLNTFIRIRRYTRSFAEIKEIASLGWASLPDGFQMTELNGI